jgi:intracellular sulfur oxidation DsrE/DsrF family protein
MRPNALNRLFVGVTMAMTAGFGSPALSAEQPIKVVYHISDGNKQASRALNNIRNHIAADPTASITVVALGGGIQFLLKDAQDQNGKPYQPAVKALAAQGVQFRVCNNTLNAHNVPVDEVISPSKIVPSGVAEVARLQAHDGFVYLRP